MVILRFKSSKSLPLKLFGIEVNYILIIELQPFLILVSDERVVVTSFRCSGMDDNPFESVFSL